MCVQHMQWLSNVGERARHRQGPAPKKNISSHPLLRLPAEERWRPSWQLRVRLGHVGSSLVHHDGNTDSWRCIVPDVCKSDRCCSACVFQSLASAPHCLRTSRNSLCVTATSSTAVRNRRGATLKHLEIRAPLLHETHSEFLLSHSMPQTPSRSSFTISTDPPPLRDRTCGPGL